MDAFAFSAAPGCASYTRVRAPHCASTWTMPRPMVPAPATAATRSLRETSSMGGKAVILAVGGVAIIVIQEEVHGLNREARGRGGGAWRAAPSFPAHNSP